MLLGELAELVYILRGVQFRVQQLSAPINVPLCDACGAAHGAAHGAARGAAHGAAHGAVTKRFSALEPICGDDQDRNQIVPDHYRLHY